jgi:hypothetical protein
MVVNIFGILRRKNKMQTDQEGQFCINGILFACFECSYQKCCTHPYNDYREVNKKEDKQNV